MADEDQYLSYSTTHLMIGEELPANLYVFLDNRFIVFRGAGHKIDRELFDRMERKSIKNLFIKLVDKDIFDKWTKDHHQVDEPPDEKTRKFYEVRDHMRRKVGDIFGGQKQPNIEKALLASKKLVNEILKFPYSSKCLKYLQTYARGTADHSVNVSVLSTYLAMNMGYNAVPILTNVSAGGLLHDIGKILVEIKDTDSSQKVIEKMQQHPTLGANFLKEDKDVPQEVILIVAQHHECSDGTGYPKRLKGGQIYDLARIVAIANTFDELVADATGNLREKQMKAIRDMDELLYRKFDSAKLEKAIRILKAGL